MKRGERDFRVEVGQELCTDCLDREALGPTGLPRRHKWYGFRLSAGCEGCGGTGIRSVKITNIKDILSHPTGNRVKNRLTPKQRYVIELRYGYKDGNRYTYREIGKLMGISHVAAWKIEERAMGRLSYLSRIKI